MVKYERCLLKISGEALGGNGIYNKINIKNIVNQVITLSKQKIQIAIVVGGGNIWRGITGREMEIDKVSSDYMGMLATAMNALALEAEFKNQNFDKVVIQSAIDMNKVCEPYYFKKCISRIENGFVVILAAGTGNPYFTTDTAAAIRAAEIKADVILMAKNGVDGVYDGDPVTNKNAKKYEYLSYDELINKKLAVMDLTAATLCQEANLKVVVFDINKPNNIIAAANNSVSCTIISKKGGK